MKRKEVEMDDLKFSQDYVVYKVKKEGVYPIKESDWARLKRLIRNVIPNKRIFQVLASIAFGVFGSAIFSLIALINTEGLKTWVIPTNWILFCVSLISGIALLILDKQQKDMITMSANDVLNEMVEIEKTFDKPE
jgi:hypothetical protein